MIERIPGAEEFAIAFMVLPICIAGVGIANVVGPPPYMKPSQAIQAPAKTELSKLTPISTNHVPEKTTLPWSCATLRSYANALSRSELERLAASMRMTKEQVAYAKRCLKDTRT